MKPFRQYHLLQFLNQLEPFCPMDLALGQYFREHKALGSKDRKYIAETGYALIRWLALVDFFVKEEKTWENRLQTFESIDIKAAALDPSIPPHIRASCPKFLFSKLQKTFGEEKAILIAQQSNERAPLTIRVNTHKISRDELFELWKKQYTIEKCTFSPIGLRFKEHINLFQTSEFEKGFFEMQDEASQLAALLVQAQAGEKILDFCAGSGGKSLAIAPLLKEKGCLFLHDKRDSILTQAKKRLKRAGIQNYQIMTMNSKHLKGLRNNMDWVLVDAPCTGSGTYRRNPDLKWKFTEEMLSETIQLQREIFDQAISYLKPGGRIVYLTCSLLQDENEEQIDYFIRRHGLKLVNNPLNSAMHFDSMDGFYGAVLIKAPLEQFSDT